MDFCLFDTPVGQMALAGEGDAISRLYLPGLPLPRLASRETPLLARGREELLEYLAGARRDFDLPLAPQGTPFQQRVWAALREIPYGQTRSYAQLAALAGHGGACRAAGTANGKNPLPILIPCHRVIRADGAPGGYAPGPEIKKFLLNLENRYA